MRDGLIFTDNVKRAQFALSELKRRQEASAGRSILVIEGLTGRGKTHFTEWQVVQDPHVFYVEANADWSSSWLMRDVAEALGLTREHSVEANYRHIREAQRNWIDGRQPRFLIIDEADRIIRYSRLIETVRGLHDAGLPLVLAGESGIWGEITRKSTRFADRVGQVVRFGDVSAGEILAAAHDLADLRMELEVAAEIQGLAGGNFRRAAKIIEELERIRKANPGEINRARVVMAVRNLEIAEQRAEKRAARRAAAGGG